MGSDVPFGWFVDFGKILTIIKLSNRFTLTHGKHFPHSLKRNAWKFSLPFAQTIDKLNRFLRIIIKKIYILG